MRWSSTTVITLDLAKPLVLSLLLPTLELKEPAMATGSLLPPSPLFKFLSILYQANKQPGRQPFRNRYELDDLLVVLSGQTRSTGTKRIPSSSRRISN